MHVGALVARDRLQLEMNVPARAPDVMKPARNECPANKLGSYSAAATRACTARATARSLRGRSVPEPPFSFRSTSPSLIPAWETMPRAAAPAGSAACRDGNGLAAAVLIGFGAPELHVQAAWPSAELPVRRTREGGSRGLAWHQQKGLRDQIGPLSTTGTRCRAPGEELPIRPGTGGEGSDGRSYLEMH